MLDGRGHVHYVQRAPCPSYLLKGHLGFLLRWISLSFRLFLWIQKEETICFVVDFCLRYAFKVLLQNWFIITVVFFSPTFSSYLFTIRNRHCLWRKPRYKEFRKDTNIKTLLFLRKKYKRETYKICLSKQSSDSYLYFH